jgi:O-acetyl-ADP-ribose deacetylase (regulator of RNase III)
MRPRIRASTQRQQQPAGGNVHDAPAYGITNLENRQMRVMINGSALHIMQGDITGQSTDAIVNAANKSLMGGGGVDGAIHRAGGPEIKAACKEIIAEIDELATGAAVITTAGKMAAKHVIHTVGPIYKDGASGEPEHLAKAYSSCLALAAEKGLKTISFPSISTGVYGYPLEEAARIALEQCIAFLKDNGQILMVRFVLFDDRSFAAYQSTLVRLSQQIYDGG